MGVSTYPDESTNSGIRVRRVITTSGWIDLGPPRAMTMVLAGGGGGGGGTQSGQDISGGGGGGGGAGAIVCQLFVGGRVYISIGAGGAGGVGTSSGSNGTSSFFMQPGTPSVSPGTNIELVAIKGSFGGRGGYGAQSTGQTGLQGHPALSNGGAPSLTGYNVTVSVGDSGGSGGPGAGGGAAASTVGAITSCFPNINNERLVSFLSGWRPNNFVTFDGANATNVNYDFTIQGNFVLNSNPFTNASIAQNPTNASFAVPRTFWTSGNIGYTPVSTGGIGGYSGASSGRMGLGGYLTGGGGGGGFTNGGASGQGGSSAMFRGGEGGMQLGVTNIGGGGGAGVFGAGAVGSTGSGTTTPGNGGAGGVGGGGGGGAQGGHANGGNGGAGGNGICLLYW